VVNLKMAERHEALTDLLTGKTGSTFFSEKDRAWTEHEDQM